MLLLAFDINQKWVGFQIHNDCWQLGFDPVATRKNLYCHKKLNLLRVLAQAKGSKIAVTAKAKKRVIPLGKTNKKSWFESQFRLPLRIYTIL